jgi:two-component system NtrC family response regulator
LAEAPRIYPDATNLDKGQVLVVDDGSLVIRHAAQALRQAGYDVQLKTRPQDLLAVVRQRCADVVVCNARMPGLDGVELMRRARASCPYVCVVLLSSDPGVDVPAAVQRDENVACLTVPVNEEMLVSTVAKLAEQSYHGRETSQLYHDTSRVQQELDAARDNVGFVADSPQSIVIAAVVRRVAPTHATCLIEGESGTGKELVARLLHYWSHRREGPFVAVNCKALAEGVVESELFGHEKGAFTGAINAHAGCFERASGGTLFLDEIGESGPEFQAKLLRVLEDGQILRVGGTKPRKVDVRVVAATNKILRKEVAAGHFREDLFFRLSVIPIRISPLRERPEDILPLARHFLALYATNQEQATELPQEVERALLSYHWPGNVRELENAIERAVVLSGGSVLTPELLGLEHADAPAEAGHSAAEDPTLLQGTLEEVVDRVTGMRVKLALTQARGNHGLAASLLGVNRSTLYRLMKRLEM